VLALRPGDEPPPGRRRGRRAPVVPVAVAGELPRPSVVIGGERCGGRAPLGWRDAAEAVLAASPVSGAVRLAVRDVRVTAAGGEAPPLLALWAASVARRRLALWTAHVLTPYRVAARGR
jgi:hypothetical protein